MLLLSLVLACALSPLALLVSVLQQVAIAILQTVFVVALLVPVVVLVALALHSTVAKFAPLI